MLGRVRRLLPPSGLIVVCTLLVGLLVYSPLEIVAYAKWAAYTSLYISNYMFIREAANYFAADVVTNPYLATWSLAVEEQFYLFWPLLIVLCFAGKGSRRRVAAIFALVCSVSIPLCIWLTHARPL